MTGLRESEWVKTKSSTYESRESGMYPPSRAPCVVWTSLNRPGSCTSAGANYAVKACGSARLDNRFDPYEITKCKND
jgi:hypothetical protein